MDSGGADVLCAEAAAELGHSEAQVALALAIFEEEENSKKAENLLRSAAESDITFCCASQQVFGLLAVFFLLKNRQCQRNLRLTVAQLRGCFSTKNIRTTTVHSLIDLIQPGPLIAFFQTLDQAQCSWTKLRMILISGSS